MNQILLPILIPLAGFACNLFILSNRKASKLLSVGVAALYLWMAFYLGFFSNLDEISPRLQMGGWPEPFAISFALDRLSALLLIVTGVLYLATTIYSVQGINAELSNFYFPMLHMTVVGVSGAFLTADLFNLYVWFEIILISSFVILSLSQEKKRLHGTIKYVFLNILSSMFFLAAVGLIYNATHTLSYDDLVVRLHELHLMQPGYVVLLCTLLFVGFAIKAALFPFYFWLPASYHHLSPAISGFFAGMLTKVGIYAIFRVCIGLFPHSEYILNVVIVIASLTMVFGVMGAIIQTNIRRILSFHIVSQVGYITLAGAFFMSTDPVLKLAGFTAGIFYMVHHILVKANLFFVSGVVNERYGSEQLKKLGGVLNHKAFLAFLFVIPGMSLAGFPPSSGFWAKFLLMKSAVTGEHWFALACMIGAGFFTIFSMIKIWNHVFLGEFQAPKPEGKGGLLPVVACLLVSFVSIYIALVPDALMEFAKGAANDMIEHRKALLP